MKIGLFIPCFVNAVYPQVGTASFKLLRSLGVDVDYPLGQTCCGQPMANGGFEKDSAPLARNMEKLFKDYDYVVGPSGSCVAFVKEHYPEIQGTLPRDTAQGGARVPQQPDIRDMRVHP